MVEEYKRKLYWIWFSCLFRHTFLWTHILENNTWKKLCLLTTASPCRVDYLIRFWASWQILQLLCCILMKRKRPTGSTQSFKIPDMQPPMYHNAFNTLKSLINNLFNITAYMVGLYEAKVSLTVWHPSVEWHSGFMLSGNCSSSW